MQTSFISSKILKLSKKVRKFKNNYKVKTAKGKTKNNENRRITQYLVMNG